MSPATIVTLNGNSVRLEPELIETFKSRLRGSVVDTETKNYDEIRAIWNGMCDRRPALIVQCADTEDVQRTVRFVRDNGLLSSVRGGGHNIAGSALCEGGVVIDMSLMRSISVVPSAKRMHVAPGATLADVDRETQKAGLAIPTGINSTTGLAGLTLGGGFGWLTRKLGLTIDQLRSAEVVLATGDRVVANESENPDLFWALRGGGGNFGVVTGFEFNLLPVGPQVFAGLIVHPIDDARSVLPAYRALMERAIDELSCWTVMRKAPPLPFIPEAWHGREVLVLPFCYCGDAAEGEAATAELRGIGHPIAVHAGAMAYCDWQKAFDPLLAPGARNYWKSHDIITFSDEVIDLIVKAVHRLPSAECEVFTAHLGGALTRVDGAATAFPQRKPHFVMNIHGRWREAGDDARCIAWVRDLFDAIKPHAAGTAYINFMPEDESARVSSVYAQNMARLQKVKRQYDPTNMFRMNQNIAPA